MSGSVQKYFIIKYVFSSGGKASHATVLMVSTIYIKQFILSPTEKCRMITEQAN